MRPVSPTLRGQWVLVVVAGGLLLTALFAPSGAVYSYPGATAEERALLCALAACDPHPIVRGLPGYRTAVGLVAGASLVLILLLAKIPHIPRNERWRGTAMVLIGAGVAMWAAINVAPENTAEIYGLSGRLGH